MAEEPTLDPLLRSLPDEPGVYIMKDSSGAVIYIGKASSLKKRVASYFHRAERDGKTAALVRAVADIEFIVTDSETEALILESSMVKKEMPRYNVRLKDDKRFPSIAVTLDEEYPRIVFTRDLTHEGYRYFGPYTDAGGARRMVATINTVFKLKTCTKPVPLKPGVRPCLNFQMKRCQGVCTGAMGRDEYLKLIESAVKFLEGRIDPVLDSLQALMKSHSERMDFEKAAGIRDIIFDIQNLSRSQKVYMPAATDQDYIAMSVQDGEALLLLFEFRRGIMLGSKITVFETTELSGPDDVMRSFIVGYYRDHEAPPVIRTDSSPSDRGAVEALLAGIWSKRITVRGPESPTDRSVFSLMRKNIASITASRGSVGQDEETRRGLAELQELLRLPTLPLSIECFDISHLQGSDPVASMVHFAGGRPDKSQYRRYRMRGHEGINDPGMIHEVVSRRLQYLLNENCPLPDLFIIDGGIPQFSRAAEAVRAFDAPVRVISIAKRFEEIYRGDTDDPLRLPASSAALKIVQRARDEAHRFAVTYHRNLRGKAQSRSGLEDIPDIGPKSRTALLKHFKSSKGVMEATEDELASVPGIGAEKARKIREFFRKKGE